MLTELSKKDKLWREIAFKICGDKTTADDIVNEMYLRRFNNDRGQKTTDYYIACTMKSIYLNMKVTNKLIVVGDIVTEKSDSERFEPTDEQHEFLNRANSLPFVDRELLTLNYEYSTRQIEKLHEGRINYKFIYDHTLKARKSILLHEIHRYKNKRVKYTKMAEKEKYNINNVISELFAEYKALKKKIKIKLENRDYLGAHCVKIEAASIRNCINKIKKIK